MVEEYCKIQSMSDDGIVNQYAPMVKRIGHHLLARLPNNVQLDDILQAGMIGLLEASKNFDNTKGASFETYAGIRVRGSMLDEVRRNDWVPRSVHRNSRKIAQAVHELENKLGRDAKDQEIAQALGIELKVYHKMMQDRHSGQLYGYEDAGLNDDLMGDGFSAKISSPLDDVQKGHFQKYLGGCIEKLPERERLVLSLYYDEELNLKEIGDVLNVSESRVCQIHSQAMHRLQSRMIEWKR